MTPDTTTTGAHAQTVKVEVDYAAGSPSADDWKKCATLMRDAMLTLPPIRCDGEMAQAYRKMSLSLEEFERLDNLHP